MRTAANKEVIRCLYQEKDGNKGVQVRVKNVVLLRDGVIKNRKVRFASGKPLVNI